jgi:hypothetical protein
MKTCLNRISWTFALAAVWTMASSAWAQVPDARAFPAEQMAAMQAQHAQQQAAYGAGCNAYGPYAGAAAGGAPPGACPYGPAPEACGLPGGGAGCACACDACEEPAPYLPALLYGAEWRYSGDAVFLQRLSPGSQSLLRGDFGTQSAELLNSKDFDIHSPAGFRASIMRCGTRGIDLETTYTRIDGFRAIDYQGDNTFLVTDANGANFTIRDATLLNTSEINSIEGNVWLHMSERVRWMVGFRFIEFDDHYSVDAAGGRVPDTVVTLRNNAYNNIIGGQFGGDIRAGQWGWLTADIGMKLGAYSNNATQNSREVDTAQPLDMSLRTKGTHLTWTAELNATLSWEVIMDRLFLRGGYQMLWIDGLLLAPEQIGVNDFTAGTAGMRFDTAFLHGAFAGAELRF